jgi:hypothetical protein
VLIAALTWYRALRRLVVDADVSSRSGSSESI